MYFADLGNAPSPIGDIWQSADSDLTVGTAMVEGLITLVRLSRILA